jgi:nitrogen fixation protein FixH
LIYGRKGENKMQSNWLQKRIFAGLVCLCLFLPGCGHADTSSHSEHFTTSQSLNLSFSVNPAHPRTGTAATLQVVVKTGSAPAKGARVEFEVWKKGESNHAMIPASEQSGGRYTATQTFSAPGQWLAIVHVTTSTTHQMISGSFQVGDESDTSDLSSHEHGHAAGLIIHFSEPAEARAGQDTSFMVHLAQDNQPLSGVNAQIEVWADGSAKHEYIEMHEVKAGEYRTSFRFPKPGTWRVKLHVEKGTLHEHRGIQLTIR